MWVNVFVFQYKIFFSLLCFKQTTIPQTELLKTYLTFHVKLMIINFYDP